MFRLEKFPTYIYADKHLIINYYNLYKQYYN